MKVEHLSKLIVVAKIEVETRSDKVDPCTGPTLIDSIHLSEGCCVITERGYKIQNQQIEATYGLSHLRG